MEQLLLPYNFGFIKQKLAQHMTRIRLLEEGAIVGGLNGRGICLIYASELNMLNVWLGNCTKLV